MKNDSQGPLYLWDESNVSKISNRIGMESEHNCRPILLAITILCGSFLYDPYLILTCLLFNDSCLGLRDGKKIVKMHILKVEDNTVF